MNGRKHANNSDDCRRDFGNSDDHRPTATANRAGGCGTGQLPGSRCSYSRSRISDRWAKTINRGPRGRHNPGDSTIMATDFTSLQAAITALTTQVTATTTVEGSAIALINGFAAQITTAVTAALTADAAANATTIPAAEAPMAGVTSQFAASGASLGAAVVANTPSA